MFGLSQLLGPFDAAEVVEHICRALKHHEVNWKCLLSLTAVTLTTYHDATRHVQSNPSFGFSLIFSSLMASITRSFMNMVELSFAAGFLNFQPCVHWWW